jgi:hypothetical protein
MAIETYQHLPMQDPAKFTQIGIFGLKINQTGNPSYDRSHKTHPPNDKNKFSLELRLFLSDYERSSVCAAMSIGFQFI